MNMRSKSSGISAQTAERFWQATLSRDARLDGAFVFGVRSTHIYCRPSCPARRPLRRNAQFFLSALEAESLGFRPCLRCKPAEQNEAADLVRRAAALLAKSNDRFEDRLEDGSAPLQSIATQLGTSSARLRRAFQRMTGLSPREFAQAARLDRFKKMLREGASITDALYACGFGSPSRIYEKTNSQLGMTPASYRKGAAGMQIGYTLAKSTLGKVLVAATDRGVSAVYLGDTENALVDALPTFRRQTEQTATGCRRSCTASMAKRQAWSFRWTYKPPCFNDAFGKNCRKFPGERRAPIRKSPKRWASRDLCVRWRVPAPRIQFR
jgi:methylphosphotriester-DNA--protein-cysteine methyltransferase